MDMLDHIKQRRTVRSFTPEKIPQHVVDAIFEAGMWAPSHGNAQPWDFVVIGPASRARLLTLL
jgi:nitroreductase